jgi:hypothetical protein
MPRVQMFISTLSLSTYQLSQSILQKKFFAVFHYNVALTEREENKFLGALRFL